VALSPARPPLPPSEKKKIKKEKRKRINSKKKLEEIGILKILGNGQIKIKLLSLNGDILYR
jgi:hypothetical protein